MRLPHIHRDRNWRSDGNYRYYRCACGATRIRQVVAMTRSWVAPESGWPSLEDRHGRSVINSGWQMGYPRSNPDWRPIWETDPNWEFPSAALLIPEVKP